MSAAAMADVAAGRMTADILARAVIAAARAYGDDPLAVLTAPGRRGRRCLPAAASGVARALRIELRPVCGVLGLAYDSVRAKRSAKIDKFDQVERVVMRAVSYAGWRPEAAASIVVPPAAILKPAPVLKAVPLPKPPSRRAPEAAPSFRGGASVRELTADEAAQAHARERVRAAQAAAKPVPWEAGEVSLSDRVLQALADMPASPSALAIRLDAKEAPVTGCIRELARQGRIVGLGVPEAGPRFQKWVLA